MAIAVNPRDHLPLLLRSLCDRGPAVQPENLVVTKTGEGYAKLTFREHQARSVRLASALSRWGLKVEDRVGTLMWNTAWHLQCYHALSCMGAVLHTLNLRLSPKELGVIIGHAADRVIIADADLLGLVAKVDRPILERVELLVCVGADGVSGQWALPDAFPIASAVDFEAFLGTGDDKFAWPDLPETGIHALCYTSGTTGLPKGAAYSQRSTYLHTLSGIAPDQLGISGSMTVCPFVPMFHVLSWGVPFMGLMLGTRMVFTGRFMDPESLLNLMLDWQVELSTGVPTVWQGVRGAIEKMGLDAVRQKHRLRLLTCGGSAPPPEMMRWYGENLNVEFLQGWGMTETNPLGSVGRRVAKYEDLSKSPEALFGNITKAGLPLPGVEVRIASADDLSADVRPGEPGELLVRGPWIIAEYFQFDAPEKFHKGWLITGDVASIDEAGAIIISDRSKDVIKSGGEWISSIDLENHITAMSDIVMAAVVAVPHPRWDERPVAIVTLAPGSGLATMGNLVELVGKHCSTAFAKFQLPDDVLAWDALPLTSTGKIDKKNDQEETQRRGLRVAFIAPAGI
mmetsp:Transcript_75505/g.209793  ORF Transcript_75505/g.209793 Transcript_75505/m.209793 type:complete len:569 (+) Transcript_75505:124-1830(+)